MSCRGPVTVIDRSRGDVGLPAHHTTVHLEWFERVTAWTRVGHRGTRLDLAQSICTAQEPCAWSEAGCIRLMRIHSSRRRPMAAERRSPAPLSILRASINGANIAWHRIPYLGATPPGTYGLENVLTRARRKGLTTAWSRNSPAIFICNIATCAHTGAPHTRASPAKIQTGTVTIIKIP